MNQIQIAETLDVEAIERELGILWKDSVATQGDEETAVMRARVANLMVFTPSQSGLDEINSTLGDLSAVHPCRALVIVAERGAADRDIELFISSFHQRDARGGKRLCCEEVMLVACGKFVPELPSAALPLLIPDLPTFLWWRDQLEPDDRTFLDFSRAADRLVIDTAEAQRSQATLLALAQLFSEGHEKPLGISDINWARLTSWRALFASFYDSPRCKEALTRVTSVVIDYSAPKDNSDEVAPQALLLAGWLASRLDWDLSTEPPQKDRTTVGFVVVHNGRRIRVQLNRVDRPDIRPGRLARAQLVTENDEATFVVTRDENGLHLETQATIKGVAQPGRVLPVRNRSTARLLARELEILCNDNIYAEAIRLAARMIRLYCPENP